MGYSRKLGPDDLANLSERPLQPKTETARLRGIIADKMWAARDLEWTVRDFRGDQSRVRRILASLARKGLLHRVRRGVYRLVDRGALGNLAKKYNNIKLY